MSHNIQAGLIFGGCVFVIGCFTWFFASRRKTFIRTFAPSECFRQVSRSLARDHSYGRGMRLMALLQMTIGLLVALISLGFWLFR